MWFEVSQTIKIKANAVDLFDFIDDKFKDYENVSVFMILYFKLDTGRLEV